MSSPDIITDIITDIIKVVVVDGPGEFRDCLCALINGTECYRCADSYSTVEQALEGIDIKMNGAGASTVAPLDLVLVNIAISGIEFIRILKEKYPALPVVVLTEIDDDGKVIDAFYSGASGYLLKTTAPAKLLESIREAASGGAPMSPEIARRVIELFRNIRPSIRSNYELTPHERRVLKLLVEGHNYKTSAKVLGVSVNTVSFHVRRIYEKLVVHSKSEAVAKALRHNLV